MAAILYTRGYWDLADVQDEAGRYVPPSPPDFTEREFTRRPAALPEPETQLPEKREEAQIPERDDLPQRAVKNFNAGNYETAAALFSELSKRDPRAFLGLGLSYYKLGDYRSAARFLEMASGQRDVDEFRLRKFLAFTYYRLDDLDQSLANAQSALMVAEDADLRALLDRLRRERPAQESFIKEETLHFKVLFDGYEHGTASAGVLRTLEEAYNNIGAQMGHFPNEPVTVILYSGKDFYDVTRMPEWSGGIFDGKIRVPLRGIDDDPELLRKVLFHEYTHALVYSITPSCPTWLNEGLAMYFSGERRERVGQLIPLGSLERGFPTSAERSATAYSVSYSAVAYLIEKYGVYSIREFLFALSRGESIEGAFNSSFYVSYNDFVNAWGKT